LLDSLLQEIRDDIYPTRGIPVLTAYQLVANLFCGVIHAWTVPVCMVDLLNELHPNCLPVSVTPPTPQYDIHTYEATWAS